MSTITLTQAPVLSAPRVSTRLRITARGRRVLLALAALPVAVIFAVAALNGAAAIASAESAATTEFVTITVLPGDTLWSLAGVIAPEADPREVVDAIVRLNLLDGGAIFVGQKLAIPAEYASLD